MPVQAKMMTGSWIRSVDRWVGKGSQKDMTVVFSH